MDTRAIAKWALDHGIIFDDRDVTHNILCKVVAIGPVKAHRWAVTTKNVPTFDRIMRNLIKRLRMIADGKGKQVGVTCLGVGSPHPSSSASELNRLYWVAQATSEGHLVFDREAHLEVFA